MFRRRFIRYSSSVLLPGNSPLIHRDKEMYDVLQRELKRQVECIELIASENFTSRSVLECLGSVATNKYAEGYPGSRYYGGTEVIDEIENLCRDRALKVFGLDPSIWGVNVQPYSGSPANFAVYSALLRPHDRLMGLDLPAGGHLTHGFYTANKRISASSLYFESLPYSIDQNGLVDYKRLRELAFLYKPRLIIAGGSAYPRDWDYAKYREICDTNNAFLMVDMSHYSALVATKEHNNPFNFADVVTTTTHKSLRGPRSGMIFFKKQISKGKELINAEEAINNAVFPLLQGGPHMHQIAAVATQLKEVMTPEFHAYIRQVKANAKALASSLMERGNKLISDGTDNHLMLWNLRNRGITGSKMEKVFDVVSITTNKNSVVGDTSAIMPSGIRLGVPAMTSRGLTEKDFVQIADFLDKTVNIAVKVQNKLPKAKLAEFVKECASDNDIKTIKKEVVDFCRQFPFPGFEDSFPLK